MAMHGSERLRNVSRTVLVYLASLALGATVVHAADATFNSAASDAFVRVRVDDAGATDYHRLGGDPARDARVVLVCECYVRNGEGEPMAALDAAEAVAESLMHALRGKSLDLVDYVTDPTGATPVTGHTVRFLDDPTLSYSPPVDGWQRRTVVAPARWVLRHTV